ncbi:Hsp20/alpha crystallin family protein [Aquimarina longa]|uniref:Hsp20/alpha crystallin family protein n=1 Tax=Aquimarina longa TaxID=1080221 RepID=UPI000782ADB7|nr:Hsp20/alpha crystallin family protein [Aquimarina longa]
MSLLKQADRLPFIFEDLFTNDWLGGSASTAKVGFNTPAVNVKESDDSYIIELAAPGLSKEDFTIELNNENLTISSKTTSKTEDTETEKYTKKEFEYSTFQRSFTIPDTINGNEIEASYTNGVLEVKLPKKEEAKPQPKRLIEIL